MINYSKCLLGLYLLLLPWVLAGQSYTFTAREIETDGELNNSRITAVKEDPDGFIWMTTLEGVARYDGYQVKWFTHSNSALRNIPDQRRIALDDEGYLWLIKNDQLDLLHYRTFEVISGEEKFKASFPDGLKVLDVYPTKDGGVIFWAEINDKRTFFLYHSSKGLRNLAFLEGTTRLLIKENSIWSTDNGYHFVEYDLKTGKALNQIEFPKFTITSASCLIDTPLKGDWFGVYQHQQKMAMIFRYLEGRSELMFSMPVEDDPLIFEQIFWYHAPSQLILLDFNKRKGREILALDQNLELIPLSNSQAADIEGRILYCDRQGILWTSSWGKCTLQQIRRSDIRQYGQNKSFRGLWSQDDLLLAQNVKFEKSQPTRNRVLEELGHFVCFDQTNKEECWVGGQNGIFQYDPEKESIIQQFPLKRTEKEQRFATLWSILKDAEGKWWGGLMGHGLASLLPGEDSLQFYQQYNEYPRLQSKSIIHLLEDGKYIWAASNIGLYLVDKNKGVVQKYASDVPSPYYLPQSDVYFLHRDQQQTYWAGTNTNGLIRFQLDEQMRVTNYQQYDKDDGLPSSVIYAIIEDEKERLWLSTNNGISCFDKKMQDFQNFSRQDGLSQLEFNRISYHQASDGQIFFGSLEGVFGFYPDDIIKSDPYVKPILVTNFLVYNQDQEITDLTAVLQATGKIVLEPSDQLFRLNIAMIDFFNTPKIRYAYKIEGLFENFQKIEGNTIEIGGLPYGSYQLSIRGRGADGRFSEQELVLDLEVVRPLYLRWWSLLLASALILLTATQIYYWRIRQLNERRRELELIVKQRTAQIEKDKAVIETQAIQLKELDELRSKFFANISHELRTPLTLLLAPMQSIIKSKELSNKNFTYLQLMRQNGHKLLKRINELLDLSRLDANRLEIRESPVFLYPFFKTLLSTFESAANLKDIQLLFQFPLDENLQVKLDEDKVEKIVANFLSNALKFTPKGGTIRCRVDRKANQLLVSVSDNGIGILPSDLIKIFDRFYQSKNNQQQEGTGIGLSLCRELAKVLGGRVWATSEIDQGSTFYLELLIEETFAIKMDQSQEVLAPDSVGIAPNPSSTAQKYRPNILIVEDNPDLRHYITMILQMNYNVETVENGDEAWNQLSQNEGQHPTSISLIISDIMMPIMDGIELLGRIKQDKRLQAIPMIMLTARQSVDVKLEALRIGVDDYLTKPFAEEELKVRVANLIQNRQNRGPEMPNSIVSSPKVLTPQDLEWLKKLETILTENLSDKTYKISDTAREMNISYRRLHQKIKENTGLTPKQYQRSIKLAKARSLLKSGQVATLQEVIYAVGMDNYSYFSKLYTEEFGIKPIDELK